jgi:hypothetical protein
MSRTRRPYPPTLTPTPEYDAAFDEIAKRDVQVRTGGTETTVTALEAVIQKQFATALSGNSHALRQVTVNALRIEEHRHRQIADDVARWKRIKSYQQKLYADYRADHGCDPLEFPHPDDIVINEKTGVTIDGPCSLEEHRQHMNTLALLDALMLQDILDRARDGQRYEWKPVIGDPFTVAILLNRTLPTRLAWTEDEFLTRQMDYESSPIRVLLKDCYTAWRTLGVPLKRGTRFPTKRMGQLLELLPHLQRIMLDPATTNAQKDRLVEQMAVERFG